MTIRWKYGLIIEFFLIFLGDFTLWNKNEKKKLNLLIRISKNYPNVYENFR